MCLYTALYIDMHIRLLQVLLSSTVYYNNIAIISCSTCIAATSAGAGAGLESLIDISSSSNVQVTSEYVGVPATSSDPMLDDFLAGSSTSKAKSVKTEEASLDDLDFWLSTDKPVAKVLVHIVQYHFIRHIVIIIGLLKN